MADQFKFVQAQNFSLGGAGAVAGATSITLKSFTQIDGTLLTMTDFGGVIGFGTLEPGNGTLEEQICWTGVVQNANGTAALTGVSNVGFVSPYTQTSGLSTTHAGATTFVVSNTAGFYDKLTSKSDDETITGTWTFPTNDPTRAGIGSDVDTAVATAFVTLGQLSRQAISGASNASTTVKGIVQLPTQAQVDAKTTTGSTGALLAITPDVVRSTKLSDTVDDTGTANTYVIAPVPAVGAYSTGIVVGFRAKTDNSGASTLNVNGLGAVALTKLGRTPLVASDIIAGLFVQAEYGNGAGGFQMISPSPTLPSQTSNAGKLLTTNGTLPSWTASPKVNISASPVTVASSTAETTLYTFSLPANVLSTNNGIRCKIYFDTFGINNTKTSTFRLKYGGSTVASIVITGVSSQWSSAVGFLDAVLYANGATNSQYGSLYLFAIDGQSSSWNANFTPGGASALGTGSSAENSTGALTFTISVQFNNSSSTDYITTRSFEAVLTS